MQIKLEWVAHVQSIPYKNNRRVYWLCVCVDGLGYAALFSVDCLSIFLKVQHWLFRYVIDILITMDFCLYLSITLFSKLF